MISRLSDAPTVELEPEVMGKAAVYVGPGSRVTEGRAPITTPPPPPDPADGDALDTIPSVSELPLPDRLQLPEHVRLSDAPTDRQLTFEGAVQHEETPPPPMPRLPQRAEVQEFEEDSAPPVDRSAFHPDVRMLLALEGIEHHLSDLAQSHRKLAASTETDVKHKAQLVSELQRILGEQLGALLKNSGVGKELCNLVLPLLGVERRKAETIVSTFNALASLLGALVAVGSALWLGFGGGW